jgi:hypothetical protein
MTGDEIDHSNLVLVERMTEDNNVKKIKRWKPMSKRPIGRPKLRWEDDVL